MTIHEHAAHWFAARRRGMMTIEERAAFAEWLKWPAHATAMAELDAVWSGWTAQGAFSPRRSAHGP